MEITYDLAVRGEVFSEVGRVGAVLYDGYLFMGTVRWGSDAVKP